MRKLNLFTAICASGATIKLHGEYTNSEANIGFLQGKARKINAVACDGIQESDSWKVFNLVDHKGFFLDHLAVIGAVSENQERDLIQRYLIKNSNVDVHSSVTVDDNVLSLFLDNLELPTKTNFLLKNDVQVLSEMKTKKNVEWDEDKLVSHGGAGSNLMLDMASLDVCGELTEKVTAKDVLGHILGDSTNAETGMFDAIVLEYRHLDKFVNKVADALKSAGNEEFFVKNVTKLEPFRSAGTVNVGAIFEMSDGQVISVLFNNPDSTPSKIQNTDTITSWKWLLNKRDVTAILQPKAVDSKKYPMIARRMFLLLVKNHERFKRSALVKQKDQLLLNELVNELESDQLLSRTLDEDIKKLQSEIDQENLKKARQLENPESGLTSEQHEANENVDKKRYLDQLDLLKDYLSIAQHKTLVEMQDSPDFSHFADSVNSVYDAIKMIASVGSTDGQGKKAIAQLHYFKAGANWLITEIDNVEDAFGYADLGQGFGGELGYININELAINGAELDLNFEPISIENYENGAGNHEENTISNSDGADGAGEKVEANKISNEEKIEAVNNAYNFANATDLFKVVAFDSLDLEEGFFASAKLIDSEVLEYGKTVYWGERAIDSAHILDGENRIGMVDIRSDGNAMLYLETGMRPRTGFFISETETPYSNKESDIKGMVKTFFIETEKHVKNAQKIRDLAKYLADNNEFGVTYNDDDRKPITLHPTNSGEIDTSISPDGEIVLESKEHDLSNIDTSLEISVIAENIILTLDGTGANPSADDDANASADDDANASADDGANASADDGANASADDGANASADDGANPDVQFLNSIISGDQDLSDESIESRLESIGENLNEDIESLFEQAVNKYAQFVIGQANKLFS